MGGASAIRNTAGSGVLASPRLLISILPVAPVADSDDDDDGRGDVTVTTRAAFVVFRDIIVSAVPMSLRCNFLPTENAQT